jgi:integrase
VGRKTKEERSRGQIIPRGDKKYLVRVFIGTLKDGEGNSIRKYASKTVNGTISQAKQVLTSLLNEIDTDDFITPNKQVLRDFLNSWLTTTAPVRVSASTAIGYRSSMHRVFDQLGNVMLCKLTPKMIQKLYADMAEEDLSPRTIELAHTVLKMALDQAVLWKLLKTNPARGAERPKNDKDERDEPEAFTNEETDLFLEAARSHPLYAMWLAFTTTGLRPQEMFALKWSDIEVKPVRARIEGKMVEIPTTYFNVQRAMKHVGKGRYEVSNKLKTKKSKRKVSLPPVLIDALTAHRRQQAEAMLASGESFERNDYIFPNRVGRPLDVNNVRDMFHGLCEAAEIRKIKLYGLRHTHATLLLAAGVHLKVVSERLGHSSIMLTGDVYSHVMPEMDTETAMTIDTLIRRSRKIG